MAENRLSKVMAAAGVASRRACEELIFAGKVKVNGTVIRIPQTLVDIEKDELRVDDQLVKKTDEKYYFILNKPKGVICSNKRIGTKRLVIDLFGHIKARLFTIGRLDRDTTGLLLVTNDGHFAQKVIHPSANITKEYLVKTFGDVSDEHLKNISKGTLIEGKWIKPLTVSKVRKGTIKIAVKEGKKREVRYLVKNAGLETTSLSRIRIGGLKLGHLEEGTWRDMTEKDKNVIFE